jgi:hypothetical protein
MCSYVRFQRQLGRFSAVIHFLCGLPPKSCVLLVEKRHVCESKNLVTLNARNPTTNNKSCLSNCSADFSVQARVYVYRFHSKFCSGSCIISVLFAKTFQNEHE